MPRKSERNYLIFLVHLTLHAYFAVSSSPPRFVDTLPSFADPEGMKLVNVVVDQQSGDVFVAGRNVLYQFSADLETKKIVKTGPVEDAQDCAIPPNSCDVERLKKDNDNYILKMIDFMGSPPKLLLCGSVYKRLCQVRPTDNLDEVHWVYPRNDSLGYNLGSDSSRALFKRGHDGQWTLFTAHKVTGNTNSDPVITNNVLVKENDGYHFRYPLQNDLSSSSMVLSNLYMRQVMSDGFKHDGYVYFVVRYYYGFNGLPTLTRLCRTCAADVTFHSYAEMNIECSKQGRVIKESLTAYYGDSPSSSSGKSLYVTYASYNITQADHAYRPETALCIFSMSSIVEVFNRTPRYCERKIYGDMCDEKKKKYVRTCGTFDTPYLVPQPLIINSSKLFLNTRLETIAIFRQYNKVFVIGGVHDGTVIKVNLSTGEIIAKNYMLDQNITIHKSIDNPYVFGVRFVFDRKGEHIYILTGNKIIKYPVASCGVYETCTLCLTRGQNDPLQCGWCAGRCTRLEECPDSGSFTRDTCNPSIYEVSPHYGTIQGGDIINITGESFGFYIDDEHNSISIAGIPCRVSVWNNTNVLCMLGSAPEEIWGPILLNVTSNFSSSTGHNYAIKGSTIGHQNFSYFLEPRLYGIYPHIGPTSGGTNVTIFGENLDYGDKDPVFSVNKRPCTLIHINKSTASCITEKKPFSEYSETIALHINGRTYVTEENSSSNINITGLSKSFEYTPDPEIHQMQPGVTTMSGLKNVTATGIFLNSVQFPKLVVEVSGDSKSFEEYCWSNPETRGTVMTCRTPSLMNMSGVPNSTWSQPLVTHVAFIMDGVQELKDFNIRQEELSRLLYYPDPEFEEVRTNGIEMLEIKGNHFNLISSRDNFNIRLGDGAFCEIRTVSMNLITCDIPPNLVMDSTVSETNFSVEVLIGYSRQHLGYVTIRAPVDDETTLSPVWWILLFIILVCVTLIVFVCFKYWKKKSFLNIEEINIGYNNEVTNDYHSMKNKDVGSSAFTAFLQSYASTVRNESEGSQITDMQVPDNEIMTLLADKNLVIPKSCLVYGEKVGSGQFGCVFEGLLNRPEETVNVKVAIKTLREHSWSDPQTVESFLKEALIMKDFDHPNVLSLLGVCFEGSGGPSIVMPFMENGDLCSYIRDETKVILVPNLLSFAIGIASGMAYLTDKKFLHRDLATRNCILDSSLTVKVADFGLTRGVYGSDYYCCQTRNAKLPHRWMAPESLEKQIYSTKTDVWSYGVLLWELMTRGSVPFANVGNWDVLEYVKMGNRLDHPKHCPKSLYIVMLACWDKDSKKRPGFHLLHECISHIRQKLLDKDEKEAVSKRCPLDPSKYYYNARELNRSMDSHFLNKEILGKLCPEKKEDLDMTKESSM